MVYYYSWSHILNLIVQTSSHKASQETEGGDELKSSTKQMSQGGSIWCLSFPFSLWFNFFFILENDFGFKKFVYMIENKKLLYILKTILFSIIWIWIKKSWCAYILYWYQNHSRWLHWYFLHFLPFICLCLSVKRRKCK